MYINVLDRSSSKAVHSGIEGYTLPALTVYIGLNSSRTNKIGHRVLHEKLIKKYK